MTFRELETNVQKIFKKVQSGGGTTTVLGPIACDKMEWGPGLGGQT
jgi:hypothetical protein